MLPLVLLVLVLLVLCYWGLTPLLVIGTPLLELRWLGWFLLGVLLWLFAVPSRN